MPDLRRLAQNADEAGDAVRQVIRAYHGSPYDFDRFDASKIGTGEGAQAYGHGLYFAGNEAVAKQYRDALKDMLDRPVPHELSEELNQVFAEYNDLIRKSGEWTKANPRAPGNPFLEPLGRAGAAYTDVQGRYHAAAYNPGRMYEVEIAHPESALLDWDAPMSKQPKVVQRVFGDMAMDMPGDGGRVYRDIAVRRGEEFDDDMTGVLADRAASQELLAEGIPGIRYLDASSRATGQGTRNYVIFPGAEDAIKIIRKYGWMLPATMATDAVVNADK